MFKKNVQWPLKYFWPFDFFLQGSDHPHCLSYKLELGSDQEIPSDWYPFATVQFGMLDTCASRTEVRSLGVESDVQPQKHVHQRACYNIQVHATALWFKLRLLELWPGLALDTCFALFNDRVCVYVLVFIWLRKEPSHGQVSLSSRNQEPECKCHLILPSMKNRALKTNSHFRSIFIIKIMLEQHFYGTRIMIQEKNKLGNAVH